MKDSVEIKMVEDARGTIPSCTHTHMCTHTQIRYQEQIELSHPKYKSLTEQVLPVGG